MTAVLPEDSEYEVKSAAEKRVSRDLAQSLCSETLWKLNAKRKSLSLQQEYENQLAHQFPQTGAGKRLKQNPDQEHAAGTDPLVAIASTFTKYNFVHKEYVFPDKRLKMLKCQWVLDSGEHFEAVFSFHQVGPDRTLLKKTSSASEEENGIDDVDLKKFERIRLGRITFRPIHVGESANIETNRYMEELSCYKHKGAHAYQEYLANINAFNGNMEIALKQTLEWLIKDKIPFPKTSVN
eukprot:CAMPEP_0204886764 /NCGR_PEP_ID=MMETSP1349-20130617/16105_1 /ASSEMBLY_ACC=CAM_ASM_000710 /TAXON_ID=215587 /ORGANISM="Aplanochytrium stocchinoi, Strain GSBS06" /LENGTH=237 /DNA_ID=CAMNT_0052049069 /DNA_START=15 /DNA_END=731 /DNA_ORIENTATION=-